MPGPLLAVVSLSAAAVVVFPPSEVAMCQLVRDPQMTVTPTGVLLIAQCRVADPADDDQHRAKVVSKFSPDFGRSWEPMRELTPMAHSHGTAIYDRVRRRVLLQYQRHPSADPSENSSLYQRFSSDDGASWGPARDITALVARCNPHAPHGMQVASAGAHIQTSSGRILFQSHGTMDSPWTRSHGDLHLACRWWTDDGGQTFSATAPYTGSEASLAEIAPGRLVMNMRGWDHYRSSLWSTDDGTSFGAPVRSPLREPDQGGCSAGLVALPQAAGPPRLFFSEPSGGPDGGHSNRSTLTLHCSLDGGESWPHSFQVSDQRAGYSEMRVVNTT
eukprot:COSAG04_NODE_4133_length_2278_cov_1.368518_1_plen_330_part_10